MASKQLVLMRDVDGVFWEYNQNGTLDLKNFGQVWFTDGDCQGQPMIRAVDEPSPQVATVVLGAAYVIGNDPAVTRYARSYVTGGNGCSNTFSEYPFITARTVPIPPALPGPLSVRANP